MCIPLGGRTCLRNEGCTDDEWRLCGKNKIENHSVSVYPQTLKCSSRLHDHPNFNLVANKTLQYYAIEVMFFFSVVILPYPTF